jgi:hypothetical protein
MSTAPRRDAHRGNIGGLRIAGATAPADADAKRHRATRRPVRPGVTLQEDGR